MAQLVAVQLPAGTVTLRGLGAVPPDRAWRAATVLGGGLLSAFGIYLFAKGHHKEAYALAIATAITGAFIGAAGALDGG